MAERALERWLRPRYVFPALLALLAAAVLLAPEEQADESGMPSLSTYVAGPWGTKGWYDVLGRLGVKVERRLTPLRAPLDSDAVYAVLSPPLEPTARDTRALLDAVRRGAGLIVLPGPGSALAESLGVERSEFVGSSMRAVEDSLFGTAHTDSARLDMWGRDTVGGAARDSMRRARLPLLIDPSENARAFHHYLLPAPASDSDSTRIWRGDEVVLLTAKGRTTKPVAMGRVMGRGRVLMIADGDFLRNGVMRRGDAAVLATRLTEWVDPGLAAPVVFDEWHQGYGDHPGLFGTVIRGMSGAPLGRSVLQLALAALILLFANAVRPIAPVPRTVIERRSPLEHVGALSRAYAAIGATRLAARRLVRGLRRRHPLGVTGTLDDDAWLTLLRARAPGADGDVDLLRRAIKDPLPAGEFVRAGSAVDHIERTLKT